MMFGRIRDLVFLVGPHEFIVLMVEVFMNVDNTKSVLLIMMKTT